jgi:hypothetical protein
MVARLAAAVFLLSLLLRLANAPMVLAAGGVRLPPFDEQYHARRIVFSALHPGHVLELDPNRGIGGAYCPWPPLYDLCAGAAARLLAGRDPAAIVRVASFFPPLLFALFTACAAVVLARRFGLRVAAMAAFALALSPFLVTLSWIGSIDHHFLEPPFVFAIVAAMWLALDASTRLQCVTATLALFAAMAAAMFVQTALVLACGLAFLLLILFAERDVTLRITSSAFALLAMAVTLYRLTRAADFPDSSWFLGWTHVALFTGAAVAAAAMARLRRGAGNDLVPCALALLLGAAVTLSFPAAIDGVAAGSHFLGGDPWLATISEFQPLWRDTPMQLLADLAGFSTGLVLVAFAGLDAWRKRDRIRGSAVIFALIYLGLSITSRRFLFLAIPLLALCAAFACERWWNDGLRLRARCAAASTLVIPAVQLVVWLLQPIGRLPPELTPWFRTAEQLRVMKSEGALLAPWPMGHLLDFAAGRSVVVDNFGSMPDARVFEEAQLALLSTHPDALRDYCRRNRIRQLLLVHPLRNLPSTAASIALDPRLYYRLGDGRNRPSVTNFAQRTVWWRLYFGTGAIPHMRRIWSSRDRVWNGSIFEGPFAVLVEVE